MQHGLSDSDSDVRDDRRGEAIGTAKAMMMITPLRRPDSSE